MEHIRAIASWITTGVVTLGLAFGLVTHHGLGQPTKSTITETRVTTAIPTTTIRSPHVAKTPAPTISSSAAVQQREVTAPAKPVTHVPEATTTVAPGPTVTYTGGDGSYGGDN